MYNTRFRETVRQLEISINNIAKHLTGLLLKHED